MTSPLIFTSFTIEDAGGGNASTYDAHVVSEREVPVTFTATGIDDDQELGALRRVNIRACTYDTAILSDSRITTDSASVADPCRITFNAAPGGASVMVDNIRLSAKRHPLDRIAFSIYGSRAGVIDSATMQYRRRVAEDGGTIYANNVAELANNVLLQTASLICPCSAGKEGVMYSLVPGTTLTPLITFS